MNALQPSDHQPSQSRFKASIFATFGMRISKKYRMYSKSAKFNPKNGQGNQAFTFLKSFNTSYTQFVEHYRYYTRILKRSMRQQHRAGEKQFTRPDRDSHSLF
jgi:hypothetical protein